VLTASGAAAAVALVVGAETAAIEAVIIEHLYNFRNRGKEGRGGRPLFFSRGESD